MDCEFLKFLIKNIALKVKFLAEEWYELRTKETQEFLNLTTL